MKDPVQELRESASQLDKAIKRASVNEDHQGPWYWVYYHDKDEDRGYWGMEIADSQMYHPDYWKLIVVPEWIRICGLNLTPMQRKRVDDAYRGMPRGRVEKVPNEPPMTIHFAAYDMPSTRSWENDRYKLISHMGIRHWNIVDDIDDGHERYYEEHRQILSEILGVEIPKPVKIA